MHTQTLMKKGEGSNYAGNFVAALIREGRLFCIVFGVLRIFRGVVV